MTKLSCRLAFALVFFLFALSPLGADTGTNNAASTVTHDQETKAKDVEEPGPVVVGGILEDELSATCAIDALVSSEPRKGVKGTVSARLVDANTYAEIEVFEDQTAKTNKNGIVTFDYPIPRRAGFAQQVALVAELNLKGNKKLTAVTFWCSLLDATP